MAETRVKVYRTQAEMQADVTDAAAHGWRVTDQRQRSDGTMSVTFTRGESEWGSAPPPQVVVQTPPPPKKQPSTLLGCAVILVVLGGIAYFFGNRSDGIAPGSTNRPPVTDRPTPTPDLVSGLGGGDRVASAGGEFEYAFEWTNRGKVPATIHMRVRGPSGKAELLRCSPRCQDRGEALGTVRLAFPDLAPGKKQEYVLTFLALEAGHIDWEVSLEDSDESWGGTTVIR